MTGTLQVPTTLRSVPLDVLVGVLREQNDVRYDVVVPAAALRYENGHLIVADGAARFVDGPDGLGMTNADAILAPTDIMEDGIADRLGIPRGYLRRMRETGQRVIIEDGPDVAIDASLLDANVNAWLQAQAAQGKRFLVRAFRRDDPDEVGIGRAFLSNKFGLGMDNLDVIMAALRGARAAGADTSTLTVVGDLSERNMRVIIDAPEIAALAPEALRSRYRDPRTGRTGADYPLVNAGIALGNSETGGGAMTATPRLTFQVCKNGMTRTIDAVRAVHIGGRLDDGIIRWSEETHQANVELVTAKTRDAIATFLNVDYVKKVMAEIDEAYETPISDAAGTIERVSRKHLFSEEEQASILDAFIKGGDLTAGGVMQAVTYAAQDVENPDRASELEDVALDVLTTAATVR